MRHLAFSFFIAVFLCGKKRGKSWVQRYANIDKRENVWYNDRGIKRSGDERFFTFEAFRAEERRFFLSYG